MSKKRVTPNQKKLLEQLAQSPTGELMLPFRKAQVARALWRAGLVASYSSRDGGYVIQTQQAVDREKQARAERDRQNHPGEFCNCEACTQQHPDMPAPSLKQDNVVHELLAKATAEPDEAPVQLETAFERFFNHYRRKVPFDFVPGVMNRAELERRLTSAAASAWVAMCDLAADTNQQLLERTLATVLSEDVRPLAPRSQHRAGCSCRECLLEWARNPGGGAS